MREKRKWGMSGCVFLYVCLLLCLLVKIMFTPEQIFSLSYRVFVVTCNHYSEPDTSVNRATLTNTESALKSFSPQ